MDHAPPSAPLSSRDVVLVSLIASAKASESEAALRQRRLGPIFLTGDDSATTGAHALDAIIETLVADDLAVRKTGRSKGRLQATEAGIAQAWRSLGLSAPADGFAKRSKKWEWLLTRLLAARALGLPVPAVAELRHFGSRDGLCAAILKQAYALPIKKTFPDLTKEVGPALVIQTFNTLTGLAVEQHTIARVSRLDRAVLGTLVGTARNLPAEDLYLQIAARVVGATGTDLKDLANAVLRRALAGQTLAPTTASGAAADWLALPLDAFARTVLALAPATPAGWHGTDRVFLNHLYRYALANHGRTVELDDFKERLREAHQAGLLELARADVVDAADHDNASASVIRHGVAEWHYLKIARA